MKSGFCLLMGLALLMNGNVLGQSAEQQVRDYVDRVHYWRYQYSPEDSGVDPNASVADSVLYMNKLLVNYLQDAGKNPELLRGNFKATEEDEVKVATSDDGKVRVYSWDTETGDEEQHIYNVVVLYDAGGVKAKVLKDISTGSKEDPGAVYPEIYTVNGSRKYYLLVYSGILSSKDARKGIRAFTIENNELEDANIFPAANGMTNKIEYTYDYYSNYDYKTMKEKQVVNLKKDKLSIPVVEAGKTNGKWNVYKFEGDKFVSQ